MKNVYSSTRRAPCVRGVCRRTRAGKTIVAENVRTTGLKTKRTVEWCPDRCRCRYHRTVTATRRYFLLPSSINRLRRPTKNAEEGAAATYYYYYSGERRLTDKGDARPVPRTHHKQTHILYTHTLYWAESDLNSGPGFDRL